MKRREARERFMQILFQMEAQQDFSRAEQEQFLKLYVEDTSQSEYFERMQCCVEEHLGELDAKLEAASENWKISRFAKVDLAILRLAAAEIFYLDDIPDSVSVNEAVELAKKFGGEDSPRFVNGILGKLVRGKADETCDPRD